MHTAAAISERRLEAVLEAVPTPGAPAAMKTLTVTATYLLSKEGRKASLLDGGDGKAAQQLSVQVRPTVAAEVREGCVAETTNAKRSGLRVQRSQCASVGAP
ncbi:MAG TPA: hypothetical protein VFT39_06800 [Vicinamibacterales bacterium]|nr:hypothetical protein [Vicinamibacterales bacterium]